MPRSFPISTTQLWPLIVLGIAFFLSLMGAVRRRTSESGTKTDGRSRLGILLQSVGIGLAGFGPITASLPPFGTAAMVGTLAVTLLMGASVAIFAASSRALGQNWSLVARTRGDHQLVRSGPYARVRHPIYLGMLLFLLGLAVALGHWLQLIVALPTFLIGTAIRTKLEDGLLEQRFGEVFRDYRSSTPAIIPRLL